MLKQSAFFDKLKAKNLSVQQYYLLYKLYSKPKLSTQTRNTIIETYKGINNYINTDCTLNDKGIKLVESMESIFKPIKQLKTLELLGPNHKEKIEEYLDIFPTGKLPNGKYARTNKKTIEENFKWFFQEYQYDWDLILQATEKYVEEYRMDNYKFMRTAMYFIKKLVDGTVQSELATYCEAILNGNDDEKVIFKTKVV
jgi:translation initiation factor 2 beta subunit (eIF-2beta)/eIF-5